MSQNKKYVRLGEKANSFYDPLSKLQLTPGVVVEYEKVHRQSRKVLKAVKTGHLEFTDAPNSKKKAGKAKDAEVEDVNLEEVEYTDKALNRYKLAELKQIAVANEVDLTEAELEIATKAELITAILEVIEEEEDEDDEDED